MKVVVATTKVGIFKQITTTKEELGQFFLLLLLPQRQEFSSKSQLHFVLVIIIGSCCCYHKGRNFQANHNPYKVPGTETVVVVATTKVGIFKQITTGRKLPNSTKWLLLLPQRQEFSSKSQHSIRSTSLEKCCCCYHKGRNFQANHNRQKRQRVPNKVVVATTKVGIFKQITTSFSFSVKKTSCCCYHKGRNFQANHNRKIQRLCCGLVVVATTKVGIFKQITTKQNEFVISHLLLLLPQRQEFSSKSQHVTGKPPGRVRCCCYHKGRNFQANHNTYLC